MNHEEKCGIVRDLMPLVIDKVAGEASRALVQAHLEECPDCRRVMEDMSAEIGAGATDEKDEKFIRFCLKLRRALSWKRTLKAVLVTVLTVSLLAGGIGYVRGDGGGGGG
jgi:predicted anti-sigma-YlaC factor YlaD